LLYDIEVCGDACDKYLNRVSKLDNKQLEVLQKTPCECYADPLCRSCNILPVQKLYKCNYCYQFI